MSKLIYILLILIAYAKIYISFGKILKFKKPFNLPEKLIIPILFFEIISIVLFIVNPHLGIFIPTILHFVGLSIPIFHFTLYSIVYVFINLFLVVTTIGLNDNFIGLYNIILATHFILTAMFTLMI